MKTTELNQIGIPMVHADELRKGLSDLLANYSIFYQNVRGLHWNIRGKGFFELHLKFEELYTDLQMKIDELAERLLTLEGIPSHKFSDYQQISDIQETALTQDGEQAVSQILASFRILLIKQRTLQEMATNAADEGTSSLMSDYIRAQEKLVWMYSAWLKG